MSLHPGLLLDKQHDPWPVDKKEQAEFPRMVLQQVAGQAEPAGLLASKRKLWQAAQGEGAIRWQAQTKAPLALHLSRATAFENAGLCLHPLYGFAYLPGSGLKGMARAFALTVQGIKETERDFELVFGREAEKEEEGAAGYVVFHDAWPVSWPKLEVDIVNCHHGAYYREGEPPEDWEDPVPVNFLAVKPGARFEFALSLRRPHEEGARLLELARGWLAGALAVLGAGAKTAAGYGRFGTGGQPRPPVDGRRAEFECTLRLVSPAFLAGANQGREDCRLRGASMRGLLRWWWRALHAGAVPVEEMRKLEGRIWGTTEAASAVQVEIEGLGEAQVVQWTKPPGDQPAPGRFYLAYGMEGNPKANRPARYFIKPGMKWRLRLSARGAPGLTAEQVRDHAVAALWTLCRMGGVGAKSRRGFGSVSIESPSRRLPDKWNETFSMVGIHAISEHRKPQSPSVLELSTKMLDLRAKDVMAALDRLGAAYRAFTSGEKHKPEKVALGLPRLIHRRPNQEKLLHPADEKKYSRHASPLHFRLVETPQGYVVRVSALHSPHLPDLATSKAYLEKCMHRMEEFLKHGK